MPMKKMCSILMLLLVVPIWHCAEAGWEQIKENGPSPRKGFSMSRIENQIYVFGGDADTRSECDSLFAFNLETEKYVPEIPADISPWARKYQKSATIDGKMYVFSGKSGDVELTDLWCWDPRMRQWLSLNVPGSWPPPRTSCAMVALNGKIYIFGGVSSGIMLNDLWCYDPGENRWTNLSIGHSGVKARYGHTASVYNGMLYFFGGKDGLVAMNQVSRYDPVTDKWTNLEFNRAAPGPRYWHSAAVIDGKMWITGGKDASGNDLGETWGYDFETNAWTRQADGPVQSQGAAVAAGTGGASTYLFLFGGENNGVLSGDTWQFTPDPSPDAPTITSFSPQTGGPGTVVTITGTGFSDAAATSTDTRAVSSVRFGGTDAASFVVNSSTTITATVGDGSTGAVTVTTANGTATSTGTFTYTAAIPTLNEWALILLILMLSGASVYVLRRRKEG
jgi:N-acetylneuraminic acid mutarotase